MSPPNDRTGHSVTRTISLPRSLDRRLVAQAWSEDRSVSSMIRLAVRRYLAGAEASPAEGATPQTCLTDGPSAPFGWGRREGGDDENQV
jgi:hypothetical protein